MKIYAEVKLLGDAYPGGFANGLSLCRSDSSRGLRGVTDSETLSVWEDPRGYRVEVSKNSHDGVTEIETEFINESDHEVTLEMLSSFAVSGIAADKVHRLQSFWSAEGKLRTETIDELHLEPSWNRCGTRVEKFGNPGSMPVRKYFPFAALENSQTGEFVAVSLYSPSSWQMEFNVKENATISLVGGIADADFGHWLKTIAPGTRFAAPKAVLAVGGSLGEVCDRLVKAQRPCISPEDQNMDIMFNEFCVTWGNPSFENVKRIADTIRGKGIKFLVIDSGWYGQDGAWWDAIGDWDVNETKFPGGMKPIADYIRSCGMIPGLWFEFESLTKKSRHYNDAEHLLRRGGYHLTVGDRRFWDMEDPWVIDYLSERVIRLLRECGFGYLKVDYNDSIGMGCDGAESLGEGVRRKVLASQAFFKKIRDEIPGIVIENCSSGGHRLEPSMMQLVSQASFSDAHETRAIPLIAANLHRVIQPRQSQIWSVLRGKDSDSRLYYSLANTFLGRMCLSGDIYNLSQHQWQIVDDAMAFYRKAADIIRDGVTTRQESTTTQYNHPTGSQLVVREWEDRQLIIYHRFENSAPMDENELLGKTVVAHFGCADCDFSAESWIVKK